MSYDRVTERLVRSAFGEKDAYSRENTEEIPPVKQRYEASFLDSLVEGVMILDQHRRIRVVNQALEQLLGWSNSELLGRSCQEILGCQLASTDISLCQNFCPLLKSQQANRHLEPSTPAS